MKKLRERLRKTLRNLSLTDAQLTFARKNWERLHKAAVRNHKQSQRHQRAADHFRAIKQPDKARHEDKKAREAGTKAQKLHDKSQGEVAKVKRLTRKKKGLAQKESDLRAELADKQGKVKVDGNKVTGGTKAKRLQVCMLASAAACASGKRPNFYSQAGAWDVDHCITGPSRGHRDDCSSWYTSLFASCGLEDPNGTGFTGGYTGTLASHGHVISETEARKSPGAAVLFGTAPFHHIEAAIGDGTNHTIGHGSAPVDMGTFDLLPGPKQFRTYI